MILVPLSDHPFYLQALVAMFPWPQEVTCAPSPHYVTCACGVRWWLLCGETREEFAHRVRLFPRCCESAPPA